MNLTKSQKVLVGILHFVPVIGIVAYFIFIFSFIFGNIERFDNHHNEPPPVEVFQGFIGAFVIIILTILVTIGVKIFDIIHLTRSNKNDTNNKILMWVLLFVFVGVIAEIVYYFMEILPEKKNDNDSL
jgi:magnesium-transporting ATPase (P-type)